MYICIVNNKIYFERSQTDFIIIFNVLYYIILSLLIPTFGTVKFFYTKFDLAIIVLGMMVYILTKINISNNW